ncbi:unannotated protein [freshwater metagenome]|uniref:Unannotated protein n=1 Tax=freshwater metagenome TaxID=449393 RepID=A0A6J7IKA2_9ZZZZ
MSIKAKREIERSKTVTSAPIPTAITAAFKPATPAPIITTRPGATPGTPPSKTPRPPLGFCSAVAPTCVASRPATSLIGARSGRDPFTSTVS